MLGFAIQKHSIKGDYHYDFMLEHNGALKTWQVRRLPRMNRNCAAKQLPDHRLAYLAYEGPLSNNRGTVYLYDSGVYKAATWGPNKIEAALHGKKMKGIKLSLCRIGKGNFILKFS